MRNLGLIITFWLASIVLPTNSFALGLGEIEVNSFLNQPLKAEIEVISARAGEIDDLLVTLASQDSFKRAGLSRPRHLSGLKFAVNKSEAGDSAVILVTTKNAVKEPFLNFLVEESCGKCIPCREGVKTMWHILERITKGEGTMDDLEDLENLSQVIIDTSLCQLGGSAPNPVLSTLRYFHHEYIAHIKDKRCPAGACKDLVAHAITEDCTGCYACVKSCPTEAIILKSQFVEEGVN